MVARTLLLALGAALPQPAIGQSAASPGSARDDRPYTHPFQNVELIDGRIPLLDLKTSSRGGRFAVVESAFVLSEDADSETRRFSGVAELQRRRMTAAEIADGRDGAVRLDRESPTDSKSRLGAATIAPSAQRLLDSSSDQDPGAPVLVERSRSDRAVARRCSSA